MDREAWHSAEGEACVKPGDKEVKKQPLRNSVEAQRDRTSARRPRECQEPWTASAAPRGFLPGRLQGRVGRAGAGGAAKAGLEGPEGPPRSPRDLFGNPQRPCPPRGRLPARPFRFRSCTTHCAYTPGTPGTWALDLSGAALIPSQTPVLAENLQRIRSIPVTLQPLTRTNAQWFLPSRRLGSQGETGKLNHHHADFE